MSTTTSPEEIAKQEDVGGFIAIHIQKAVKIVVTKVEDQAYEYLGEATYNDPD
jgi:hypothetical protein